MSLGLCSGTPLLAQDQPASRWTLGLAAGTLQFSSLATTLGTDNELINLRPASRIDFAAAVARRAGPWELGLELAYAGGSIRADIAELRLVDQSFDMTRLRFAVGVSRRIVRVAQAEVFGRLSPALDVWRIDSDARTRLGAETRLILSVPLGAVALRHYVAFGLSGNPLKDDEMEQATQSGTLRAFGIGAGVVVGL